MQGSTSARTDFKGGTSADKSTMAVQPAEQQQRRQGATIDVGNQPAVLPLRHSATTAAFYIDRLQPQQQEQHGDKAEQSTTSNTAGGDTAGPTLVSIEAAEGQTTPSSNGTGSDNTEGGFFEKTIPEYKLQPVTAAAPTLELDAWELRGFGG